MITKINVDGFKSLNNFSLDLKPGLNVLVGPNGGGKTNIIQFFEFISFLAQTDLHNAVAKIGGAGSVFSKKGETYGKLITADVQGCSKIGEIYVYYKYEYSIEISFDNDSLFFKKQKFSAQIVGKFLMTNTEANWDLEIIQGKSESGSADTINIISYNFDKLKPKSLGLKQNDVIHLQEAINNFFVSINLLSMSILQIIQLFGDIFYAIRFDYIGGETFNIIPSKVKLPEDSANPPGVQKDGSGLANTLYSMIKQRNRMPQIQFDPYSNVKVFNELNFKRITEMVTLANKSISKIDVINDQFSNQLVVKISIRSKNNITVLPLSSMSDGTTKWIALITAILTSTEIFSIEEPENFLHPWMQAEIIKIMRNSFHDKNKESFILMTTHSETIINQTNPEELIIISLDDGKTITNRLKNIKAIQDEINKTGFGLGFYYTANAFENE